MKLTRALSLAQHAVDVAFQHGEAPVCLALAGATGLFATSRQRWQERLLVGTAAGTVAAYALQSLWADYRDDCHHHVAGLTDQMEFAAHMASHALDDGDKTAERAFVLEAELYADEINDYARKHGMCIDAKVLGPSPDDGQRESVGD